jgi:metallophosphoesterase superfamily enzyme
MTSHVIERVIAWRARFGGAIELALGNHDQHVTIPDEWRVRVRWPDERDGPFAFCHEPCASPRDAFTWCGHLHPTVRLERRFDAIVLPCFAIGARQAILPAFTAFSRGLAVDAEPGMRRFAIAQGEVVEVAG